MTRTSHAIGSGRPLFQIKDFRVFLSAGAPRIKPLKEDRSILDMTTEPEYVVWSNEHSAWWGANRAGYNTHLSHAGRYARNEAVAICRGARGGREFNRNPSEVPILLQDAEAFWTDDGLAEQRRREHEQYIREVEADEAERLVALSAQP